MTNECIRSHFTFGIYFYIFCENHTFQNLSRIVRGDCAESKICNQKLVLHFQNTTKGH